MKKLGVFLCVILVAISMSACRAFHDDTTENYPQDNPLETTIFLQIKNLPTGSNVATELATWQSAVNVHNASKTDDETKIVDIKLRDNTEDAETYPVDLKINHVPASTLRKQVYPFKIIYTQTIYNPIALLPNSDVFTYLVGYETERRHSDSNTDQLVTNDDGTYVYLWTSAESIQFIDVYPNRPLYYLIIVTAAFALGTFVWIISRYNDCKKRKKML